MRHQTFKTSLFFQQINTFACFFFLLSPTDSLLGKELQKIKNIQVYTKNTDLKTKLEKELKHYLGEKAKDETFNKIKNKVLRYLSSNKYLQSSLKDFSFLKGQVSFRVRHPYQYHFIIRGADKISATRLYKELGQEDFFARPHFVESASVKIKNLYRRLSFKKTVVSSSLFEDPKKYVKFIRLTIQEGPRFIIQNLSVSGSFSKKPSYYSNLIRSYLPSSKYYTEEGLEQALKKTVSYLKNSGFFEAHIYHKNIYFDQNKVFIEIVLNESSPLIISEMNIQGNKYLSSAEIRKIISLKKGEPLSALKLEEGLNNLMQTYFDQGFLKAQIKRKNMIQTQKKLDSARLFINIYEGSRSYVDKIKVEGHHHISSDLIISASSLKKGELITHKKLETARGLIENLELFSSVRIEPTPNKKNSITIKVREQKLGYLSFKVGGNTQHTFSVKTFSELSKKKLFGDDRSQILLNAEIISNIRLLKNILKVPVKNWETFIQKRQFLDYFEYYLSGSYKKFHLFNTGFNWQTSYAHSNNIFSFSSVKQEKENEKGPSEVIQWIQTHKFSFNLERKFSLGTTLNFRLWEIDLTTPRTQEFYFEKNNAKIEYQKHKSQIISETGLDFTLDKRNSILFPTKGVYFESDLNYSSPFIMGHPDIHFIRGKFQYRKYKTVKSIVLAGLLEGGGIYRLNGGLVPVRRLFILGGPNSLRGFDGEINGTRIPDQKTLPIDNPVENKDYSSAYALIKNELRFPLYKKRFFGALFYDLGLVYLYQNKLNKMLSYGHSTGFGFYGITPVGPIAVNIAFQLGDQERYTFENLFNRINISMSVF